MWRNRMWRQGSWRIGAALLCVLTLMAQTAMTVAASVVPTDALSEAPPFPAPAPVPQTGTNTPMARISSYVGAVGVRNSSGWHQVVGSNVPLYSGDKVVTERGRCEITFNDGSLVRLDVGANITIAEKPAPSGGILRTITQYIGNLWFNVQKGTGTETHLETPTAVAAIRGTQGWQEVPDDSHSTHALTEGVEQITERVTGQSVTIHGGQQVTAIRGVGFTAITSIAALLGGAKYPMTNSARQLPKAPKNFQQTVSTAERAPRLAHLTGINSSGLIVETVSKAGFTLPSLTTILIMAVSAVVGGVIVERANSGNTHPNQNPTSVGGPTVGVGKPQ